MGAWSFARQTLTFSTSLRNLYWPQCLGHMVGADVNWTTTPQALRGGTGSRRGLAVSEKGAVELQVCPVMVF